MKHEKSRSRSKSADRGKRVELIKKENDAKSKPSSGRKQQSPQKRSHGDDAKKTKSIKREPVEEPDLESILQKVKPRKISSAYIFFNQKRAHDAEHPYSITNLAQESGKLWQTMTEDEKKPYYEMQEADRRRFNKEMQEFEEKGFFVNSEGVKSTDLALSKPKFKDNVVMPKKVLTPYTNFVKSQFKTMQAAYPTLSFIEVSKQLSIRWNEQMSEKDKKPYYDLADLDARRYDREYHELITQGYFTTVDGKKSTSLKKKVKRSTNLAITEVATKIESDGATKFGSSSTSPAKKTAVKRSLADSAGSQQSASASKKLKKSE